MDDQLTIDISFGHCEFEEIEKQTVDSGIVSPVVQGWIQEKEADTEARICAAQQDIMEKT